MLEKINVFVINLKSRNDRRLHIINEFCNKSEFDFRLVEPIVHKITTHSLWNTIKYIIQESKSKKYEYVVICEDDHTFSEEYSYESLMRNIETGINIGAEIISGGVSWADTLIQVSSNLFLMGKFTGLQFTIIFKKFYDIFLNSELQLNDAADLHISYLSKYKFVIYPFISTQKEFGYSDVTQINNGSNRVEKLFEDTSERFELLKKVRSFYLPDFKE